MSVRHLRTSGERSGLENKLGAIGRRRILYVMRPDENTEGGSVDTKREGEDRDPGPPPSDVRDSSSGGRDKTKRTRWHRGQVRKWCRRREGRIVSDAGGGQTERSGTWPWNLAPWRFLVTSTREESGSPTGESPARVGLAKAGEE